ncbi:related to nuclear WD protein PRL1 [Cephalotrichum gorgonifer]|uniref:Related to nuclear WD protein PRL1 n=1 Tax=Cephalotrichum gorgonifer TaxID=2041049 RepID=A0AAE8SRE2_9PEZI|nr:related to nuclear WD protein PRL1 [Cephalotrichum gorgonifer]
MVSDEHYEICLPVLEDSSLDDENKTDKLLELLKTETTLAGTTLENAILDVLWRYREGGTSSASPPPIRQTILRRPSPASWRSSATPLSSSPRLGVSPLAPLGYVPTPLNRTKSSTASPFSSPRPSPRLNFATPVIPHSPNLNAYEFANDTTPAQEINGEYPTENVDWLVNDDGGASLTTSYPMPSGLNAAAPEFSSSASAQQTDMTPYDMLRTILGQSRTDDEIETALAAHGFDLSATVVSIMDNQARGVNPLTGSPEEPKKILVGRSATPQPRPSTPVNPDQKSGIICKFYLSSGQCLRSDCRFSHDLSSHLCKYWMMGNCLAGDTCVFSHDPAQLVANLSLDGNHTPPSNSANLYVQDYSSFPTLHGASQDGYPPFSGSPSFGLSQSPGLRPFHGGDSRPRSRPGSRHQSKDQAPALDDNEAFPTLGAGKPGKKHHGKRGGHGHKEAFVPGSLADIVKMAPSPSPSPRGDKRPGRNGSTGSKTGENSVAAQAIPSPKLIPWLETGERANKAYLKARQEAIKHGGLRNKFLQSAAQAWNRNDARAAKALSLRGQSENDLMRKAHREAARELYEQRNKQNPSDFPEIYVDLHGLHPEEAVGYLEKALLENSQESRPVFAITGTGNHSKNGKDKVGKAVRNFLNEWRYAFREFSVPGDKNNMGGILGIDARSWDKSMAREGVPVSVGASAAQKEESGILSQGVEIGEGKVKLLVREPPKGPSGSRRLVS